MCGSLVAFVLFCWSTRRQQIQIKNFYAKLCEKVCQVLYILSINQLCIWKILCLICFSFASAAYLMCLHIIIYLISGIFPAQQAEFYKTTHPHTRTYKNCFDIKQIVLLPLPVFVSRSPSLSSHSTRSSKRAAARWRHSYHFTMWNSFSFFAVVLICLSAFCNWLSAIVNQLRSIIKWFAITDNRYKQRYLWFTPLWVFLEQLPAIKWVKNTTCLSFSHNYTTLEVNFRESGYTFGRSLDLDTYRQCFPEFAVLFWQKTQLNYC